MVDLPATMTAWYTSGDGIDALRREPGVAVPRPGPHEVLLQTTAHSLNYRDLLVVNGVDGWRPGQPIVPITDAVGVVVACGDAVTRFAVGDRASAIFLPRWHDGDLTADTYVTPVGGPVNRGMLAEFVVVREDEAVLAATSLSDVEAAALPIAGLTAWHAVAVRGKVGPGDIVLVHGTGGVALFVLQLARALGARVAITSSSPEKLDRARALGAELTVDYRTEDVADAVLKWTDGRGVDHVVETVGGDNLNTSLRAVRIGGSISFIGLIAGRSAEVNTYEFVTRNVTIHGIETGSRKMFEDLNAFVDEHEVKPVIERALPAAEVRDALRLVEQGKQFGKVVLTPPQ